MGKFDIESLGPATVENTAASAKNFRFPDYDRRLPFDPHVYDGKTYINPEESFEIGGPREKIFFRPEEVTAAIITCGGLCPGLNAVIRTLVLQLHHEYGVNRIMGIKYGYQGFALSDEEALIPLDPSQVEGIDERGGTILGTSRGTPGVDAIAERLQMLGINMLFVIGGDGTMRGAKALYSAAAARGFKIAIVGIPKTIDNDIPLVKMSFGFQSAVEEACKVINCAHEEARGARNGIGLVKLMGRHSGYVAANATLASGDVNFCLVPEAPFSLEGKQGLLALLEERLVRSGHAVVAVAEGAGQNFFADEPVRHDKSGNIKLNDIGVFLKDRINEHFTDKAWDYTLKYIDPSYVIRSIPATMTDRLFCARLARNAVHAAMAGKTNMFLGYWHGRVTHVPLPAIEMERQTIDPQGKLWFNVRETTGQPLNMF